MRVARWALGERLNLRWNLGEERKLASIGSFLEALFDLFRGELDRRDADLDSVHAVWRVTASPCIARPLGNDERGRSVATHGELASAAYICEPEIELEQAESISSGGG